MSKWEIIAPCEKAKSGLNVEVTLACPDIDSLLFPDRRVLLTIPARFWKKHAIVADAFLNESIDSFVRSQPAVRKTVIGCVRRASADARSLGDEQIVQGIGKCRVQLLARDEAISIYINVDTRPPRFDVNAMKAFFIVDLKVGGEEGQLWTFAFRDDKYDKSVCG